MSIGKHIIEHAILGTVFARNESGGSSGSQIEKSIPDEQIIVGIDGVSGYTLNFTPSDEKELIVFINGILVHPSDYWLSGNSIVFKSGVVQGGDNIIIKTVLGYNEIEKISLDDVTLEPFDYTFTATSSREYTLPRSVPNKTYIIVSVNGHVIPANLYETYGSSIVFASGSIQAGDQITIKSIVSNALIHAWNTISGVIDTPQEVSYTATNPSGGAYEIYLPFTPRSEKSIIVHVNGLALHPDDYSLDGELLTINAGVIETGDEIVIKTLTLNALTVGVDARSVQSPFALFHDSTNGHIVNFSGELHIDTVDPVDGISGGKIRTSGKIFNAVWNDYADFWDLAPGTKPVPGLCYADYGHGLELPKRKGDSACIGIITDTYGYGMGERSNAAPVSVAGFVLAYVDKPYKPGTRLIAKRDGTLTKLGFFRSLFCRPIAQYVRQEKRIIYQKRVIVNERHWVKVV